jgi:hypothetical protein
LYNNNGTLYWNGSAVGNTTFNSIQSAVATGALDNTNFAQTWNWSTLSTQTGLALNFSVLTSGNGLAVTSTSTSATGNIFSVISSSTSAVANGLARFYFTGGHTGNGVQIDDETVSGNALSINADNLVAGHALLINAPSGSAMIDGAVKLNLSGGHSGYGLLINDGTNMGTSLQINNTGLTGGSALVINATTNAFFSTTEGLLKVYNNGASSNATVLKFQANNTAGSGLYMLANGRVGVGTSTPGAIFSVQGAALAQAWNTYSDRNLKENILDLNGSTSLDKILTLKPVTYNFKNSTTSRLGFIAQDVETVFPEAVSKDDYGTYVMNYTEIISPLVKAMQELYNKIPEIINSWLGNENNNLQKICLQKTAGGSICVTGDELEKVLENKVVAEQTKTEQLKEEIKQNEDELEKVEEPIQDQSQTQTQSETLPAPQDATPASSESPAVQQ